MAADKNEHPGNKAAPGNNDPKMTRGEALTALGSMAASIPFTRSLDYKPEPLSFDLSRAEKKLLTDPVLSKAVSELEYLTPADKFRVQRRGNPVLTEIPPDKLPAIGLTRETWRLEVLADPESNSDLANPLSKEKGNALDWAALMKLAETKAIRFLHTLTCTNVPKPYGMGLWEGIPLRDVFWMTNPKQNIRRIFFYGYHNDDPKQIFQASLSINRVLEEVPGELPVILCYRLNGKYISQANGGPVRLIVPGLYGNRWIKWLQRIVVTNSFKANDTYAEANNDVEVPIKTCARFISTPENIKAGQKFAITGLAQVGLRGLSKVQYAILPADSTLPKDDPYLTGARWHDAIILPPPSNWGSDLPDGKLPGLLQFDPKTGQPLTWPVPNTICHWAALVKVDAPGKFDLRCRTIDLQGTAQPMPYPFGRSGNNRIESAKINCTPA